MARDNSPKIRQRAELERKKTQRASYDRVLIVSEVRWMGSLAEPALALPSPAKRAHGVVAEAALWCKRVCGRRWHHD